MTTAESLIATTGLRTSLQEIANAAGILTGSLYHHFASKEDLLIELVRRYHADIAQVGTAALRRLDAADSASVEDRVIELASEIARCAVRNRAALQMSFFEAPTESPELMALLRQRPVAIQDAMVQTLRAGRWSGYLRSDVDLVPLADRICQSLLHVGLDVIRRDASTEDVATVLCQLLLHGVAAQPVDNDRLDRSAARAAADQFVRQWESTDSTGGKFEHIQRSARTVFGRKGFELTTIRDIAAEAGLNAATVYRVIGSMDQLLASIMQAFGEKVSAAIVAALSSESSAVEKLDALTWIHINAVLRFPDEWKIQLAWMRHSAPDSRNPAHAFDERMQDLSDLLSAGLRQGELRVVAPSLLGLLTRCVIDVLWLPENLIQDLGPETALAMARDDVIRGIVNRG
ncbi:TetR/AcrR family transcriptional regulator [[Mycobacterium] burgundiense]|uniref:TetR/AcrR family transcriptional regulator n=1 Tax=[Mycobacterium] burgundiense TaxID=3064286 RepID=A0ABN9NTX8_9MYCO|nr:TetR/AcrR family transcriptional regulator [Mycolicibacterium sp. MU0053]CAJ1510600.1 TetR/AcrR family transcriptional regulator [Mycolicibacterium sp. MU0053]